MPIKLKIQNLGTLYFCLYFEIKVAKAKLKYLQLLYTEHKQMGKKTKAFNKTENGALLLFYWHTNLN